MSDFDSTFFALEVKPNLSFQTKLECNLLISHAVINPDAESGAHARLFIQKDLPVVHLDTNDVTTAPLNIYLSAGSNVELRVAGETSIHLSGYYQRNLD